MSTDLSSPLDVSSFPTTGAPRLDAPGFSWQQEWYVAASLSDLPRLERALQHGALPEGADKHGHTAAHWYAFFHDAAFPPLPLTSDHKGYIWSWLASKGVPLNTPNKDKNTPLMILTSHTRMGTRCDSDATASALWNAFSCHDKKHYLSSLEKLDRPRALLPHPRLLKHKAIASLEDDQKLDALFFLGSLLRVDKFSLTRNTGTWDTGGERGLFWNAAYGPPWLYTLLKTDTELCNTLNESLRHVCLALETVKTKNLKSTLYTNKGCVDINILLEKRLTTLLQHLIKADFPLEPPTYWLLERIEAVRPLLDARALQQALDNADPPASESMPSSVQRRRPRL